MAMVYHGTPLTPRAALEAVGGRSMCVSYFRPDCVRDVERLAPFIMYDNGAFSFWQDALRRGLEWADDRDWRPFYRWVEPRLFMPGRWAVIPDRPGAPSQLSDALLTEWPFGTSRGAPLWHMNGPINRLGRLLERYDRVCLGWIGEFDPAIGNIRIDEREVGCPAYRRRMDEVAAFLGNRWPVLHMMRGVLVGGDYPFITVDSTSLAQNHNRYRLRLFSGTPDEWSGVVAYADRLERLAA